MTAFLVISAGLILATVALGLARILHGPGDADRIMAAQLLGTGGVAALLLLGAASGESAVVDVALTVGLLTAFASVAFYDSARRASTEALGDGDEGPGE